MTGKGHKVFGMAFAVVAAVPFYEYVGPVPTTIMIAASWFGSTAPDWLEIRFRNRTLLRHRGITHVFILWAALMAVSLMMLFGVFAEPFIYAGSALFGFSLGGISHWIGDVGTPMGVPVWHPKKRVTLRRWRGRTELVPICIAWSSAIFILTITLTIGDDVNLIMSLFNLAI